MKIYFATTDAHIPLLVQQKVDTWLISYFALGEGKKDKNDVKLYSTNGYTFKARRKRASKTTGPNSPTETT